MINDIHYPLTITDEHGAFVKELRISIEYYFDGSVDEVFFYKVEEQYGKGWIDQTEAYGSLLLSMKDEYDKGAKIRERVDAMVEEDATSRPEYRRPRIRDRHAGMVDYSFHYARV